MLSRLDLNSWAEGSLHLTSQVAGTTDVHHCARPRFLGLMGQKETKGDGTKGES